MITLEDYVGPHAGSASWNEDCQEAARDLLDRVNPLIKLMEQDGIVFLRNPNTGTLISGQTYGGFRPKNCPIGAPDSSHKQGMAVDLYDPVGEIDVWCMSNRDELENFDLYIEHPSATQGWCHLTTRAPRSGNRVFFP